MASLDQSQVERIFTTLKVEPSGNANDDALRLLEAYNDLDPGFAHKLSVVQFGIHWVGVDFDCDRSCWYNPGNRYYQHEQFYYATLMALAIRLQIVPGFGLDFSRYGRVTK